MVYQPIPPASENGPVMDGNLVVEKDTDNPLLIAPDVTIAKVVFGPELPPELAFRRNFETFLQSDVSF